MNVKLTSSGQLSLPAEVRRRWKTAELAVEDHGDHVVVRPARTDPIDAAYGVFAGRGVSSSELRRRARADEDASENRRPR